MTNRFWPINWEVQDIPCQSVPQTIPLAVSVSTTKLQMGQLWPGLSGYWRKAGTGGGMQWGFPASTMNWMLYRQKWMSKLMLGHWVLLDWRRNLRWIMFSPHQPATLGPNRGYCHRAAGRSAKFYSERPWKLKPNNCKVDLGNEFYLNASDC